MGWEQAEYLLAERIGLDASTIGTTLLHRAVERRMAAHGLHAAEAYLALLQRSAAELAELAEEVAVPESWFFRDGQPFLRLQQFARAGWLGAAPRATPLRVLSIPCAGGEEPYSIALALLETGLAPEQFHIDALDLSTRQLDRARRGIYARLAFRGPRPWDVTPYFREHPQGLELDPAIRALVRFEQGNLIDPELLTGRAAYHVVFCRNLLIYLTASARRQAVATLARLLPEGGLLFVGHAETLPILHPWFVADADWGSFAYVRTATSERAPAPAPPAPAPAPAPRPAPARDLPPPGPWGVAVQVPEVDQAPDPGRALLDQAAALADRQRHDEAQALCERSLRVEGPSARAFFLLGMLHLAAGADERAEANLLKAVYLDGGHDEALLALALISERRGDAAAAARYRQRAQRAGQAKGAS